MMAILSFRIFAKNAETKISFYLLNRVRFCGIFGPTGYLSKLVFGILKKIPKNDGHLEFLPKMQKHDVIALLHLT